MNICFTSTSQQHNDRKDLRAQSFALPLNVNITIDYYTRHGLISKHMLKYSVVERFI